MIAEDALGIRRTPACAALANARAQNWSPRSSSTLGSKLSSPASRQNAANARPYGEHLRPARKAVRPEHSQPLRGPTRKSHHNAADCALEPKLGGGDS